MNQSQSEISAAPHSGDGCKLEWTQVSELAVPRSLPQGTMLEQLESIERLLPDLLKQREGWKTLDIAHCEPRVERVYQKVGELWIALHCIHPCEREAALLHPHPWPSAIRIIDGKYEMGVAYGSGNAIPPLAATVVLQKDSSYEMVDPDAWHYVRPLDGPSLSLMVTGAKWERSAPKNSEPLRELSPSRMAELLEPFQKYYSHD